MKCPRLVATWIIRPASGAVSKGRPVSLEVPGEKDGINILYMVAGSARFLRKDGEEVTLRAGDALTHDQGALGDPFGCSPDMSLLRFFIAARALGSSGSVLRAGFWATFHSPFL